MSRLRSPPFAHQPLPLGGVAAKRGDQVGTNRDNTRAALASLDYQATAVEIDIGSAQPNRFPQPQSGAVGHQDQGAASRPG